MKRTTLFLLLGLSVPAVAFSQDATEIPVEAQSEAKIQVRGEETSAEAKIRRLQQKGPGELGKTRGEQLQKAQAREERRTANAEKRAAMNNDTANPAATPLQANPDTTQTNDTSDLANPASQPLQDTVPTANPESMPVEESRTVDSSTDTAPKVANPAAVPAETNPETAPVTDTIPQTANPAAMPVTEGRTVDPSNDTAPKTADPNPETTPVTGTMPEKTGPDAQAEMKKTGTNAPEATTETPAMIRPTATEAAPAPESKSVADAPAPETRMIPTKRERDVKAKSREKGENQQARAGEKADRKAPNQRTARVLEETKRDRREDVVQAENIEDDDDAKSLLYSVLGGAAAGAIAAKVATSGDRARAEEEAYRRGQRLPVNEVGRTQADRDQSVTYLERRFQGNATLQDAPYYRDQRGADYRPPVYYEGNRRVVRYATRSEIPPVLIASDRLDRVDLVRAREMNYRPAAQEANRYYSETPAAYSTPDAYAVSYAVDPESAVSRDDILFQQGSTAFADAYSYDLVLDLAEAMNTSTLQGETFIVEGHASAEGDYGKNLALSQERAERIARDLVAYGVAPERLVPVGYGEGEATYPASAPEGQRALDRRVMVFRME